MDCPQCHNDMISSSGICLVCGFQPEPDAPAENPAVSGMIEVDYADKTKDPEEKTEIPEWRRELSERLKAIKEKREQLGALTTTRAEAAAHQSAAVSPGTAVPIKPVEKPRKRPAPARVQEKPAGPVPQQKELEPLPQRAPEPADFRRIIDDAISLRPLPPPVDTPVEISFSADARDRGEGKLILLSRILSGLIDLIVVIFCTGAFIITADLSSGILVFDSMSLVNFSGLFLLIYFLYSLFFLAASNQTLGMMITDLRVVGLDAKRPRIRQIVARCLGFLVSFFGLGIGLLWSLFDSKSLCFHDHISHTQVVRVRVFEP